MAIGVINDLKQYSINRFTSDLIAGLTVAVILIPQGMAYSMLAGLKPIYGLYAAIIPMVIYPFFGSSRVMSIGPVALMSIIILSGVSIFAKPGTPEYLNLVLMTGFISGLIQIIFYLFKLGGLSNLLSTPVMSGFISAAGVIIAISQIKYFLTLKVPRSTSVIQMLIDDFGKLSTTNFYSLGLGIVSVFLILMFKKIHNLIPGALIVVVIGSIVMYFTEWEQYGVPILGDLPEGLPKFYSGFLNGDIALKLFPESLIVAIICFIGSFSIAKTLSFKIEDHPPLSANKELLALGLAKTIGSFFLAMPSTGSFTRSAINLESGAKTQVSSIIAAVFIGLTLLFFSSWFYYLPEPILAAIVITSVFSLIDVKKVKELFFTDKSDFWALLVTFFFTLILGIVNGILIGIALSLFIVILRSSKPHYAKLGHIKKLDIYRNIDRYPDAEPVAHTLILRYDQDLFFGNAEHFYTAIINEIRKTDLKNLILHIGSIHHIDSSARDKIVDLIEYCKDKDIRLFFTNLSGPMRDYFHSSNLISLVSKDAMQVNVSHAVSTINNMESASEDDAYIHQVNVKR